jgi:uncharacterized transporter YbjL
VPILGVGLAAHLRFRLSYTTLFGVLAGNMTDPPALAVANAQTRSEVMHRLPRSYDSAGRARAGDDPGLDRE